MNIYINIIHIYTGSTRHPPASQRPPPLAPDTTPEAATRSVARATNSE